MWDSRLGCWYHGNLWCCIWSLHNHWNVNPKIRREIVSIRKIADPPKICTHPEHKIPSHMVFAPGTYEHVCPGCGKKTIFTVPLVWA